MIQSTPQAYADAFDATLINGATYEMQDIRFIPGNILFFLHFLCLNFSVVIPYLS